MPNAHVGGDPELDLQLRGKGSVKFPNKSPMSGCIPTKPTKPPTKPVKPAKPTKPRTRRRTIP
jgi:hypothetical protein